MIAHAEMFEVAINGTDDKRKARRTTKSHESEFMLEKRKFGIRYDDDIYLKAVKIHSMALFA